MSEWLQHRGDNCAKRKNSASEWARLELCLLLGKAPAMPGLSCWGCVCSFRAEEPEGPSALISLQGFLDSHSQTGFIFFNPLLLEGLFPVGVRGSRSLLAKPLSPRYSWSIPAPGIVPSATQPCVCVCSPVECPLCLCDIWTMLFLH